jgi:hypothetical protein
MDHSAVGYCSYSLAPPLWAGLVLYGATIAAAALCLRATSLRTTDQAGVVIILSLLLAPMGLAVWRWESHRRRRHVAGTIRGIMEPEGVRLAAILQDRSRRNDAAFKDCISAARVAP